MPRALAGVLAMSSPTFQGKRRTPCNAIKGHCRWCNGGENPKSCTADTCPLYEHRACRASEPKTTPLRAIRARCLDCAGSANAVCDCSAFKDYSEVQTACDLWPHREGKRLVSAEYRKQRREQAKEQRKIPGAEAGFVPRKATKEHDLGEGSPKPLTREFKARNSTFAGEVA